MKDAPRRLLSTILGHRGLSADSNCELDLESTKLRSPTTCRRFSTLPLSRVDRRLASSKASGNFARVRSERVCLTNLRWNSGVYRASCTARPLPIYIYAVSGLARASSSLSIEIEIFRSATAGTHARLAQLAGDRP